MMFDENKRERRASVRKRISVVIPSTGRVELSRAVESVFIQQGDFDLEIIVVLDLAEGTLDLQLDEFLRSRQVRIAYTGGCKRGGFARNRGVELSTGEWVAFLDDDDWWVKDKIAQQLALAEPATALGRHPVISSRVWPVESGGPEIELDPEGAIPKRLIGFGEPVGEYLFEKRRPGAGRASMFTSTLLVERDVALRAPWDASLSRHQDWDWLLRLGRLDNVVFVHHSSPLVHIQVGSSGSISASSDWRSSLDWAIASMGDQKPATYVDFIAGQTFRYSLQARSLEGVKASVSEIRRAKVFPNFGPIVSGFSGILGRRGLERVMRWVR